jgi:aspartate/methionine/tyrosine aminotransferase
MNSLGETSENKPLNLGINARNLSLSPTLEIDELVAKKKEKHEVLHMGFGESTMPLHPSLRTALADAATYTRYGPVRGIRELREAIAGYLNRTRKFTCSADQIVIGPGSKSLIYALIRLLEGDVLLPSPSWVSYAPIARLGGKKAILIKTDEEDHHTLPIEILSDALKQAKKDGANPQILLVNSPDNPTGTMFATEDVRAMASWAKKNGITLISDEIYSELAHGWRDHVSPFLYYPEGCVVTGGLSKTFSAGGWRLGYAVLPATETGNKVIDAIRAFGSEVWSTTSAPIQKAAVTAFSPNKSIEKYIHCSAAVFGYTTRELYETFINLGISCPRPAGGFYLYPDFSHWRGSLLQLGVKTGKDLAHYLFEEWNIATLPASAFNEDPLALRLRLSTSRLCEPEKFNSPEEREEMLWKILDKATKKKFTLSVPVLTLAQERWTKVIQSLEKNN